MRDAQERFRLAILAALGYAPELTEPGRIHRFSTSGRSSDKAGWCQLFEDGRAGVFGDFRSRMSSVWTAQRRELMTPAERADMARRLAQAKAQRDAQQRQQWADNAQRNAALWAKTMPVTEGDPVWLYLRRRGVGGVWPLPGVLRLHRALPYWHNGEMLGVFPAMVAPIVAPDGRTVALNRTYLCSDGHKADVPTIKKLTGAAAPLAGACIPLFKPVRGCIGIAEGIETALAACCASGVPTEAAYCAGNLAAWHWPAGVQRLVIFADHDAAGVEAAEKLQGRALRAGLQSSVMTPTDVGADWCDVWADCGAVLVEAGAAA